MLSLALPRRCLHCDCPVAADTDDSKSELSAYLCSVCLRIVQAEEPVNEPVLRARLKQTAPNMEFRDLVCLHRFEDESPVRSMIHAAKYNGMMRLGEILGQHIRTAVSDKTFDAIVPVPLHRTRMAERGYNQSEQLARGTGYDVLRNAIRRSRPTRTQTELHPGERLENVRGAFALTQAALSLRDKDVLIVDDVMTTGATISSVAETLLSVSPRSVSIVTVAMAQSADHP